MQQSFQRLGISKERGEGFREPVEMWLNVLKGKGRG